MARCARWACVEPGRRSKRWDDIGTGLTGDLLHPAQVVIAKRKLLVWMQIQAPVYMSGRFVLQTLQAVPVLRTPECLHGKVILPPGQHLPRTGVELSLVEDGTVHVSGRHKRRHAQRR